MNHDTIINVQEFNRTKSLYSQKEINIDVMQPHLFISIDKRSPERSLKPTVHNRFTLGLMRLKRQNETWFNSVKNRYYIPNSKNRRVAVPARPP